jgi:hypothetical protein
MNPDETIYQAPLSDVEGTFEYFKSCWRSLQSIDSYWFICLAKDLGRADEIGLKPYR